MKTAKNTAATAKSAAQKAKDAFKAVSYTHLRKYTSFEELTPTLLREFVEKIVGILA